MITLAMTGASGAVYGLRLLEQLIVAQQQIYLVVSAPAQIVINMETDVKLASRPTEMQALLSERYQAAPGQLQVFGREQWTAPIASGSAVPKAMVVCPCSSGTLAAIASGLSRNLIERAADVVLKEQRKLILVHRETPLSVIHLENMLRLAKLGALILPANPGFYHNPQRLSDLVDFMVARILDHLDIEHTLLPAWGD
ncbi:aromatic acid decarboxylase [Candidatus Thiomargarita nelsonii]|uniref:Flavin prenyltransferase UbiX n=1 Tax=Candidatus Thiomargarita nelsonii TaxID=1003181 RepID=A0A0A6P1D9_9GAMM|nr:aromatic acid decarboxylase [Candidatus Thiomargarita nelsonii]